jgi:hypothetical protein
VEGDARAELPLSFLDKATAVDNARELLKKGFRDVRVVGPNFEMGADALKEHQPNFRRDAWSVTRIS